MNITEFNALLQIFLQNLDNAEFRARAEAARTELVMGFLRLQADNITRQCAGVALQIATQAYERRLV